MWKTMVRNWDTIVAGVLTIGSVVFFVVILFILSSTTPCSAFETAGWVFGAMVSSAVVLHRTFSKSVVTTKISNKLRQVAQHPYRYLPIVGGDGDIEDDEGPSLLGEAVPLTESDRKFERTPFRPFEVLYHMDKESRDNLFEDAQTQTREMWETHRPEDYEEVHSFDFKPELLSDKEGGLDLNVVPISEIDVSDSRSDRTPELSGDFANDVLFRIVRLARLHDEIDPRG